MARSGMFVRHGRTRSGVDRRQSWESAWTIPATDGGLPRKSEDARARRAEMLKHTAVAKTSESDATSRSVVPACPKPSLVAIVTGAVKGKKLSNRAPGEFQEGRLNSTTMGTIFSRIQSTAT